MSFSIASLIMVLLFLLALAFNIFVTVLIVRALLKYLRSKDVRKEKIQKEVL